MMTLPLIPHGLSHDILTRRASVRRALAFCLGYAFVLLFTLAPLLLLGKNISLPLLDWLDGDITGKVLLGRNLTSMRDYFSPQIPQMMRGAAMWSNAPSTLLYAWLAPFSAYVAECFLAVSAAYWGMALFLRRVLALVTGGGENAAHADMLPGAGVRKDGLQASGAPAASLSAPPFPSAYLCAAVAVLFSCLPFYTVHDLTTMGIPLVLWAFVVLWTAGQRRAPHSASPSLVGAAYGAVLVFGACSTLAFSGYFILGFLMLFFLVQAVRRRFMSVRYLAVAFALLCALYGAANFELVQSLFAQGASDFVSHRTIYAPGTLAAGEVFSEFKTMLLHGQYHAGSKHLAALACAALILAAALPLWKRLDKSQRRLWLFCAGLLGGGVLIAVFYAFCGTAAYARFVALLGPAIASFQFDRLYFLYPTLWYTLLAGALLLVVRAGSTLVQAAVNRFAVSQKRASQASNGNAHAFSFAAAPASTQTLTNTAARPLPCLPQTVPARPQGAFQFPRILPRAAAVLVLAACCAFVLRGNYLTGNWRAVLTGEQPASAVTWRQFFAEDLFDDIRAALAAEGGVADASAPVVVSLGISPAIALYNGFSTLDGYSNNYALSYHEQFGRVLHDEINKDAALASYFYDWGNRCYLFTPQLGADFSYRRSSSGVPRTPLTDLAFNWPALRAMGGTHLLSIAPIADCAQYGLTDCGKFTGEAYDLYVYAL